MVWDRTRVRLDIHVRLWDRPYINEVRRKRRETTTKKKNLIEKFRFCFRQYFFLFIIYFLVKHFRFFVHNTSEASYQIESIYIIATEEGSIAAAESESSVWHPKYYKFVSKKEYDSEDFKKMIRVLQIQQKFIHPRFFIYSSKVCIYCTRIAIGCTIIQT